MAEAANRPKLKEAFEKHLVQTEGQLERLQQLFDYLSEKAEPKVCKAMMGLLQEGERTTEAGQSEKQLSADLSLVAAVQRVEHYEISAYGTARVLARLLGELERARLLSHTLGEEESTDFLFSAIAHPLLQQLSLIDLGREVDLESVGSRDREKSSCSTGRKKSRK